MPGMLKQAQNPNPSSGPGPQTPPVGNPGAGTPLPSSASGPGQPPPQGGQAVDPAAGPAQAPTKANDEAIFTKLRDEAVQRMYGENFDELIQMFQTNGAANFPRSMAIAVNSALEFLTNQYNPERGPADHALAARIGMDLMFKLLEDIIGGGVLPDVTLEQVQQSFPAILMMYSDAHDDVTKQDVQDLVREVHMGLQQQGELPADGAPPGAQPGPEMLSTGPGPEPSGSPVPPGAV